MSDLLSKLAGKPSATAAQTINQSGIKPQNTTTIAPGSLRTSAGAADGEEGYEGASEAVKRFGEVSDRKDGLYREGGDLTFVVDGLRFTMPPFEPQDFYRIENYLKAHRKTPIDAITESLAEHPNVPQQVLEALYDRVYADIRRESKIDDISRHDVSAWMDTRPGLIYSMWIQMRKRYQNIQPGHCRYLLERLSIEKAIEMRDESRDQRLKDFSSAPPRN